MEHILNMVDHLFFPRLDGLFIVMEIEIDRIIENILN